MSECGGWCVTVKDGDSTRLFMVANKNRDEAIKLVLACAGDGAPFTCAEVSEQEIADLCMEANDVKESAELGPKNNA